MTDPSFPVTSVLPDVIAALQRDGNVVIKAPTGAGKTTLVPPELLDAGFGDQGLIVMLEPRRLAAQASARWMAAQRREPIGKTFGYHIRFDRRASRDTRVLVVTEGVFLRMLLEDPLLENVAVVLFDEFHERSLNSDLALALSRRVQTQFRPDLKLVAMSATFDPERIAKFLDCSVVACEGRLFPVDVRYLRYPSSRSLSEEAASAVTTAISEAAGDVLVFLPGVGEIRRTTMELQKQEFESTLSDFDVLELYGELPIERQQEVLEPSDHRKVILATNVAETSITIPGVTAVIDSGYARSMRCDPAVGLNRLQLVRISRASADQRAGRAGRTQPGICLRLWSAEEWRLFADHEVPEVARLDLASAILQLHAWGENDVQVFPWFQTPPRSALDQAEALLQRLGAITPEGLTELGRDLARLPVHPRLARLLIEGHKRRCLESATTAAALLSERDPFERGSASRRSSRASSSDVLDRVQSLEAFANSGTIHSAVGTLHAGAAQHIIRVREQLLRETRDLVGPSQAPRKANPDSPTSLSVGSEEERFLRALVAAYPDRVARRRDPQSTKGVMVGGRGIRIAGESAIRDAELFVCVDIEEVGSTEALVRQASRVEREWLSGEDLRTATEVEFDAERERVVAFQRTRYHDLLLDEAATDAPNSAAVENLLAEAAGAPGKLERALPLDDPSVAQFLARVHCLRGWMPELELPQIGGNELRSLLPQLVRGRRSFADLQKAKAELLYAVQGLLSPAQFAAVQREAPEAITAASGSRIRLEYAAGRPPVMAVRIQEMYGQLETPRVAGGRVPVLLHLLAPNQRAQQITDDLRGFWERGYPIVRKELRRRYPKHSWPDDPANAPPERRPTRR